MEGVNEDILLSVVILKCGNMAREGLRTLVVGKKVLSEEQYACFEVSHCLLSW